MTNLSIHTFMRHSHCMCDDRLSNSSIHTFTTHVWICVQLYAKPCWITLYDKLATMQANSDPWPALVTPGLFNIISTQVNAVASHQMWGSGGGLRWGPQLPNRDGLHAQIVHPAMSCQAMLPRTFQCPPVLLSLLLYRRPSRASEECQTLS